MSPVFQRVRFSTAKILEAFRANAQAFIAVVGLIFTVAFSLAQQRVASSNLELARTHVKVALIPSTTSNDAQQRLLALSLSRALDPLFAAELVNILLQKERDKDVYQGAVQVLGQLLEHPREDVRAAALRAKERYEDIERHRAFLSALTQDLVQKLAFAQDYLNGNNPNANEEALKLYREVDDSLSEDSRQDLDRSLLEAARKYAHNGNKDEAAEAAKAYQALFGPIEQESQLLSK